MLDFSCALVTGGGGIGKAFSEYLGKEGKEVIVAGRTESNLASTAKEIIDCLINNAGVQRPLQVLKDNATDFLEKADQEIDTNIRGPMHLAPPTVAMALHREREGPDDSKKDKSPNALSVEEFVEEVAWELERGDETIGAGMAAELVDKWFSAFGDQYAEAAGRK